MKSIRAPVVVFVAYLPDGQIRQHRGDFKRPKVVVVAPVLPEKQSFNGDHKIEQGVAKVWFINCGRRGRQTEDVRYSQSSVLPNAFDEINRVF